MVNQWIKFEISSFSCSGDILRKTENLMSHMTITTPFLGWFIIVLEYWRYWWNLILKFLSLLLSSSPADGRHFHVRCLGRRGSASSHSHLLLFFLCSLQLEGSGSKPNTWDLHLHWPHSVSWKLCPSAGLDLRRWREMNLEADPTRTSNTPTRYYHPFGKTFDINDQSDLWYFDRFDKKFLK